MDVCEVKLKQDLNPYDVTLVAEDGKEFKAHRQALSEASPFFEKVLSSDMKENQEGVIRLEMLSESQMADILEFIYTGNVQISTNENAENLIAAADYLCLSNLKHIAGKFLEQNLSTSNCFSTLHLAEEYHCDELIGGTRKFIYSNFATIAETEHFLDLSNHEVEKLISSDEIVIDGEEDVFKIILRWIERKKMERSVKFSDLFRHVRLTCVSRDFLLNDVVTNDLVKDNKDCLHGVTEALAWFNGANDVPRPHSPRKSLETCVMVVLTGDRIEDRTDAILYVPGKDEICFLPISAKVEGRNFPGHVVSHGGKVFFVPQNILEAQCYDPVLNHWIPAPWTLKDSNLRAPTEDQFLSAVLVVKNEIFFVTEEVTPWGHPSIELQRYNIDANWSRLEISWPFGMQACFVALDKDIYVIGGCKIEAMNPRTVAVPQCARFVTNENKLQDITNLQEARKEAFGAVMSTHKKIFIAGGKGVRNDGLKTCEVYNVETDEWHFVASLNSPRPTGNMVLVDGTLYVVGNFQMASATSNWKKSGGVECYDHREDKWEVVKTPLVFRYTWIEFSPIKACSFRLFKGDLKRLAERQRLYTESILVPELKAIRHNVP